MPAITGRLHRMRAILLCNRELDTLERRRPKAKARSAIGGQMCAVRALDTIPCVFDMEMGIHVHRQMFACGSSLRIYLSEEASSEGQRVAGALRGLCGIESRNEL